MNEQDILDILNDDKNYDEVKTKEDGHIIILGKELNHNKAAKAIMDKINAEKEENDLLRY